MNPAEERYKIVVNFHQYIEVIREEIENDLNSADDRENERGIILYLLDTFGIRAVWKYSEKNYSIKVNDVTVEPNGQNYFLVAKIISTAKHEVSKEKYDIITRLQKKENNGGSLFTEITEEDIKEYLKDITSNDKFTMEIFQIYFACKTMEDTLWNMKVKDIGKVVKNFNDKIKVIAKFVNRVNSIGDTRLLESYKNSILRDYIDPAIIYSFCKRKEPTIKGISINDFCDANVCKVFKYAENTPADYRAFPKIDKYEIARKFHNHIEDIRGRIAEELMSTNECDNESGIILYLLDKTGIRHGTERDGATTGCCSLKVSHVKLFQEEQKYFVTLSFNGKCNIPYSGTIEISKRIHEIITKLTRDKSEDEDIFSQESEQKVVKYLKSLNPNFTMKDFRTYLACISLERNLWAIEGEVINKWEAMTQFHKCINVVGAIMNHKQTETIAALNIYVTNPKSTLSDYIDPRIIHSFCKRMGISISDICEDALCKSFKDAENTPKDFKAFPSEDNNQDYVYKVRESDEKRQIDVNDTSKDKYKIVEAFHKKIDDIHKRIDEDLQSDDKNKNKRALILSLLDKAGIKINFGTDEGTSGNSSVNAKDVKVVTKYFLIINTIDKIEIPITEEIKGNITGLKENNKDGDSLLTGITEEDIKEYLKEITSNDKFKMEIFQTYFACKIMKKKLSAMKVKDEAKIIAKFNQIVNLVATIMANKKKVIINGLEIYVPNTASTLRDFVDPTIIHSLCKQKRTSAPFTDFLTNFNNQKLKYNKTKVEADIPTQSTSRNNDNIPIKKESKCKYVQGTSQ